MKLWESAKTLLRRLKWFSIDRQPCPDSKTTVRLCKSCSHSLVKVCGFRHVRYHRKSCSFCSLLHDSIKAYIAAHPHRLDKQRIDRIAVQQGLRHQLDVTFSGTEQSYSRISSSLRQHLYHRHKFRGTFQLRELLADSTTPAVRSRRQDAGFLDWGEMRQWLSSCDTIHGKDCCSLSRRTLIEKPESLTLIDTVNLCLTQPAKGTRYAALSYVWGGVEQLGLCNANKDDLFTLGGLLDRKYWQQVPATVRDAIEVTREIGVRYLWVDALCIEQDPRIDIATQTANMHNIFGSAYVTLIAAQGRSAASGLVGTSNRPRSRNIGQKVVRYGGKPLTREIGPGSFYGLVARRCKLFAHGTRDSTKTMFTSCSDIRDSKWHTRAWTMQEGLLSERCLVFIDDQVFWHCKNAVWCEPKAGREKEDNGFAVDARYAPLQDITSHLHFAQKNLDREALRAQHYGQSPAMVSASAYKLYKDMVESYTQRDVGKPSDKLVAFNGISNIVEQCLQTHLHYGLPESLIDVALLWQPVVTLQRIHGADLPSWSWADFQGAIQYQYHQAISATGVRQHNTIGDLEERVQPIVRWHKVTSDGIFKPIDGAGFKTYDSESHPQGRYLFNLVDQAQTHNVMSRTPSLTLRAFAMQASFTAQKPADPWFSAEAMSDVGSFHDNLSFNRIANYFCIYSAPNKDKVIGEFIFDDVEDAVSLLRHHHEIDFIAISKAQVFRSHRMNHETRGDLYARPFGYTLYNVMAIRRLPNSDAVERIGLGRMFQDEWHQSRPTVDWVNVC